MTLDPWRPSWAWAIREAPPLPEDVEVIRSAAKLFHAESDYGKAETLLLEALALAEELIGSEDRALVPLLEPERLAVSPRTREDQKLRAPIRQLERGPR